MRPLAKFSNAEVARLLREVAAAYEVKGADRFHIAAYNRAADSVEHATSEIKDLWDEGKLEEIPGIGKSIATYLDEYFRRGKVLHFKQVKKGLPLGMFKLSEVPGVGAKSAYKIAKSLRIESVSQLKKFCKAGKVAELEGFGAQSEREILKGIEELERRSDRLLLPIAWRVAEKVIKRLKNTPGVRRVDPMGSLRRMCSTVGDVDIAVATKKPTLAIDTFTSMPDVKRILVKGEVKASVILKSGYQVDLRAQDPASYGAQLQYFTGSKDHNIRLRKIANEKGLSLSEYGVRKVKSPKSKVKSFSTEEAFYKFLEMSWIPPELREDAGEIEAVQEGRLPRLVELKDIKGDLHVHCDFPMEESHDPGVSSMEEIIKEAQRFGYNYIGLSNHSPSVSRHTQERMRKLIKRKNEAISKLRSRYNGVKLLNVLEVDILANRELALGDEALKMLDFVIAAVHSNLRQSKEEMTKRILVALENPYVHALAHPTGRLLLEREGSEIDWEEVFKTCLENKKVLEINAFPKRLDLPDTLVREAVKRGVKLIINTDAHEVSQMDFMPYGVAVARRGWAEKSDIINTLSWSKFRDKLG